MFLVGRILLLFSRFGTLSHFIQCFQDVLLYSFEMFAGVALLNMSGCRRQNLQVIFVAFGSDQAEMPFNYWSGDFVQPTRTSNSLRFVNTLRVNRRCRNPKRFTPPRRGGFSRDQLVPCTEGIAFLPRPMQPSGSFCSRCFGNFVRYKYRLVYENFHDFILAH